MSSFPPAEAAYEMAHINDNRGYQQTIPIAVFGVIAFVCVALRPFARRSTRLQLGLDDWLIIASMFFGIGLVITGCLTTKYGVGRHLLAVITQTPEDLVKFGQVNFALQIFYAPTLALAKLSILAFYARIFRVAGKSLMYLIYATAVWIILWFIGVYLVIFLGCRPIHTYWTATCAPTYTTSVTTSVFNIISDIAVIVLPQAQVWGLQMPVRKKLGLSVVFLLGVLATVMSIARIPILKAGNQGGSIDITYNLILTYIFTVLEPMIAIICACLPVLQAFFVKGYASGFGFSSIRSLLRSTRTDATQDSKWSKIKTTENESKKSSSQRSLNRETETDLERAPYELKDIPGNHSQRN